MIWPNSKNLYFKVLLRSKNIQKILKIDHFMALWNFANFWLEKPAFLLNFWAQSPWAQDPSKVAIGEFESEKLCIFWKWLVFLGSVTTLKYTFQGSAVAVWHG